MAGCGPSLDERKAKEESKRKEQIKIDQKDEKHRIEELERKYDAVYFPPQEIGSSSYTYEIQNFFKLHEDDNIVLEGYLEDIEASENTVVVEFLLPLGNYFFSKEGIRFRLTVPDKNVGELLKRKRSNPYMSSLRFLSNADYLVIAKVINLQKIRKFEFDGTKNGEEVEIEEEVSRGLVATGQLIRAAAIPKEKEGGL